MISQNPVSQVQMQNDFETLLLRSRFQSMHLQWFAAEDEGRTEDPTERKIQKAREDGKVAKSQDVTGAIILLLSIMAVWLLSSYLFEQFRSMMFYYFSRAGEVDVTESGILGLSFYHFYFRLFAPIAAVAFTAAAAGNILQVGFLFSTKPITPDLQKVSPNVGKWLKRSFAGAEAGYNLLKAIGKVIIVGIIAFTNIYNNSGRLVNLVNGTYLQGFQLMATIAFQILMQTSIIMLLISFFDYRFQRKQHIENLKMSVQEVKEERKTYEGDPMIRGKMRQRMQEMMSRNIMKTVPKADVIVTNPTHFAVALEYDRVSMTAPMVSAKGQDEMAFRIRRIAQENGVPIVENKPLARTLYAEVEVGDSIPANFYMAVVTVLKQVYQMKGRNPERERSAVNG
ncbi:flagellar biosynthesis protein FlhB [Spirochaeta dissipatitropha]